MLKRILLTRGQQVGAGDRSPTLVPISASALGGLGTGAMYDFL